MTRQTDSEIYSANQRNNRRDAVEPLHHEQQQKKPPAVLCGVYSGSLGHCPNRLRSMANFGKRPNLPLYIYIDVLSYVNP